MLRRARSVGGTVWISLLLAGCGGGGPPHEEIDAAVRAYVEQMGLPPTGMSCLWGSKMEISEVRVLEVGKQQEMLGSHYWPVRARVIGGCRAQDNGWSALMASEWDRTLEFNVGQDGFGEWSASYGGGLSDWQDNRAAEADTR